MKMCLCLNNLINFKDTVAILDLGGAPLQITYYLPTNDQSISNNTKYIKQHTVMGKQRQLYNHR